MLILRPNWPEMYDNLTMEFVPPDNQIRDRNNLALITILGVIIAFHLKQHVSSESSVLLGLLTIVSGVVLVPLMTLLLAVFWCYRTVAVYFLKGRPGYRGLMDGADAYWSVEDVESRAIINILSFMEYKPKAKEAAADLLTILRALFQSRLLTDPQLIKLKCKRQLSKFGYYYWEEQETDIDKHIRWMDLGEVTDETLQNYVSKIGNDPLPDNNKTFWEILVSRNPLVKDQKKVYPVIFRLHHAIGDGVALVDSFMNKIIDQRTNPKEAPIAAVQKSQRMSLLVGKQPSRIEKTFEKISRSISAPLLKRPSLAKIYNQKFKYMHGIKWFLQKISVMMFAPVVFSSVLMMKKDVNKLHSDKTLSGKKHMLWRTGEDTIKKIKDVKNRLKCRFNDVVLMAVSNSFESHFSKYGKPPAHVTLVIPSRISENETLNKHNILSNSFAVGMMKLAITGKHKFHAICTQTRKLRIEPQILVNYWLLKVVCTYFPLCLFKELLKSRHSTLALSNIPGPQDFTSVDGNNVDNLVFWIPNRETTGVGVSVLSYAGKLNFGLIVDEALIAKKEEAKMILDGIFTEIDKMYDSIF